MLLHNLTQFIRSCTWLLLLVGFSHFAAAQKSDGGDLALGALLGDPSGLTFKIHRPAAASIDILLAWDLNDFFFANVQFIWEEPLSGTNGFYWFYGPGVFAGVFDRGPFIRQNDDFLIGVSGALGISYYFRQFEVYLQLSPRLSILERTSVELGAGLGIRYFF